ncbi:unnamed protein product [Dibothriocephalus latus]|uniref:Uncharacterized protein n=1 Tax=Dibothriocephalus latus TaxID=60516 RepID=A0A3P7S4V1_DIBLA|nr:unnamed protein product [Dibothriocephalus latus]
MVSANVDLSSQDCFSALNQPFEAAFDTPDRLRQRAGNVPPSRVCVATQWPQELVHLLRINEQYSDRVSSFLKNGLNTHFSWSRIGIR